MLLLPYAYDHLAQSARRQTTKTATTKFGANKSEGPYSKLLSSKDLREKKNNMFSNQQRSQIEKKPLSHSLPLSLSITRTTERLSVSLTVVRLPWLPASGLAALMTISPCASSLVTMVTAALFSAPSWGGKAGVWPTSSTCSNSTSNSSLNSGLGSSKMASVMLAEVSPLGMITELLVVALKSTFGVAWLPPTCSIVLLR